MGGATIIYKSRGIKKVLTKTEEGTIWVEEKLEPVGKTKAEEGTIRVEEKLEPVRKAKKTVPVPPLIGAERLRVADVLVLLGISRSTLYAGVATGRYPAADGKDGNMPFWKASTIKRFLDGDGS